MALTSQENEMRRKGKEGVVLSWSCCEVPQEVVSPGEQLMAHKGQQLKRSLWGSPSQRAPNLAGPEGQRRGRPELRCQVTAAAAAPVHPTGSFSRVESGSADGGPDSAVWVMQSI